MSWIDESLRWYLTSLAAGLAFAPLAAWLFRRLPGHGAWFARPVGLLATVWPVWFLASVTPIPYATWLLWAALAVGGAVGWALAIRAGTIDHHWVRSMIMAELVFLAAFVVGIVFRGYVPKIAGTEQPMDVGFLASNIRATDMPPRDQWFAGEPINYYYLGYLINGSVARMSGLPSWVAYNLALVGTFATTVVVTAGLARAIAHRLVGRSLATLAAAAGAFLIVIAGNMRAPIEFLRDRDYVWNTFWFDNVGWRSSRVIVDEGWTYDPITEFPSFSFILGDLHPHVTTLPFTILTLAIAVSLFLRAKDGWRSDDRRGWAELAVAGVAVGALYPLNSWDFPTYAGAIAVAVIAVYGLGKATVQQGLALGAVSILAWSPFWVGFVPFAGGSTEGIPNIPIYRQIAENAAGYSAPWTTAGEYLTVFGLLWAIAMLYLLVETFASWSTESDAPSGIVTGGSTEVVDDGTARAVRSGLIALGVVAALLAIALPAPVVLLSGVPVALAVRLIALRWREGPTAETVVPVLLAVGFWITLLTEFFYVRDTFNGRYNTLFKIYYQVWTLLGIGCAVAVVLLWRRAARSPAFRIAMMAGLVAALALGSAYPVISGKTLLDYKNDEREWRGLDGLQEHGEADAAGDVEPISRGRSPDDVAAIRWLNDHAREGDVLLEAPGCIYQLNSELPTSRFSAFTGIPTVIGWDGSEGQWRGGQPELSSQIIPRAGDVSAMYEDPDPDANPLFDQYGITLLIVGDLERYGANGRCDKAGPYEAVSREGYPGSAWVLEFEAGETRIYRRATG